MTRLLGTGQIEQHEFTHDGITVGVRFERNWLGSPPSESHPSHLEIRALRPERVPLPVTETGYLSHFVAAEAVDAAGGPLAYIRDWIEEAALHPAWQKPRQQRRQLELF